MKSRNVLFLLLAAVPMLMMVSCKKEAANSSTVKFKLTDAPGAYDAVNIDIRGIEVYSEGQGWVTFNSNLGVVNLLDYMNGHTTLLAEGNIEAGTVSAAHLIIGTNNSVVIDGVSYPLQSSAALQAGLSVNLNNQLQAGETYEWTIDFDAAQSIQASSQGSYTLIPTLHLIVDANSMINANGSGNTGTGSGSVTIGGIVVGGGSSTVVNGSTSGSISGSINTTIGLAMVYATDASGHTTSTMTSITGGFTLQAVQQGTYNISIDPVLPLLSTHTISNVQVSAGQTTSLGLISM